MLRFSILSVATLLGAVLVASACGGNSSGGYDDSDAGSDSGGGGQGGGTGGSGLSSGFGGTGTGGTIAGTAGCGPCLRIACLPPVTLLVVPDVDFGASAISDLTVDIPGINVSCYANTSATNCQWNCSASQLVSGGHYAATVSAPGYESQTIEFDLTTPTNCGCCGCGCGASFQATVALRPTGEPVAGCCAALESDPYNCGDCGRICSASTCTNGECTP